MFWAFLRLKLASVRRKSEDQAYSDFPIKSCMPVGNSRDIYRGSYMSAHVLLNLLNKLGKRDKMRALPSILSLFLNEFNKFNNTRVRMLDSIYHMTLRLF